MTSSHPASQGTSTGPGVSRPAAATLAVAFQDDPLFSWVVPDPDRRRRALSPLFVAIVRRSRALGGVVDVDEGGGVAAWVPADRVALSPLDLLRFGMIRTPLWVGLAGAGRLQAQDRVVQAAVSRYASAGDAYLWVLGADPARRGQGYGRRAVEACVAQVRAAGARRLLLVTENPANVPLYRHLGFDRVDEVPLPESELTVHVFCRDLAAGSGGQPPTS